MLHPLNFISLYIFEGIKKKKNYKYDMVGAV